MSAGELLAAAWRAAFVTASGPVFGAVLLAAIARLTGARWQAAALPPIAARAAVVGAALLGVAQAATVPPPHLSLWLHPLAVGARAILVAGGLAVAGARLRAGASQTEAGVWLAVYAWLATPIASDWLLGQVPGHPVSAVGMMLVTQQIAGACALALVRGAGDVRMRSDLGKLMIAAALGVGYLTYMDFLIVWFGNLPARVPFYIARGGAAALPELLAMLLLGIAAPIALLAAGRGREAGASVLLALGVFNLWWVAGGLVAGAIVAIALAALLWAVLRAREPAHD